MCEVKFLTERAPLKQFQLELCYCHNLSCSSGLVITALALKLFMADYKLSAEIGGDDGEERKFMYLII